MGPKRKRTKSEGGNLKKHRSEEVEMSDTRKRTVKKTRSRSYCDNESSCDDFDLQPIASGNKVIGKRNGKKINGKEMVNGGKMTTVNDVVSKRNDDVKTDRKKRASDVSKNVRFDVGESGSNLMKQKRVKEESASKTIGVRSKSRRSKDGSESDGIDREPRTPSVKVKETKRKSLPVSTNKRSNGGLEKGEQVELLNRWKRNAQFTVATRKYSDSDSEADFERAPKRVTKKKTKKVGKLQDVKSDTTKSKSASTAIEVGNLSDSGSETEMKIVDVAQTDEVEVKAIGEDDDSSASEWEDVLDDDDDDNEGTEEREPIIPKDGVEITLSADVVGKKRQREDVEGDFRRFINRIKKNKQLNLHKIHLMCLVAHARYANGLCQDEVNVGFAMSLLTGDLGKVKPKKATEKDVSDVVRCYRREFRLKNDDSLHYLRNQLGDGFCDRSFVGDEAFVLGLVVVLRSIGFDVRFVMSMQPLSMKAKDLVKVKKKEDEGTPSTKEVAKVEKIVRRNRKIESPKIAKPKLTKEKKKPKKGARHEASTSARSRSCVKKAIVDVDSDELSEIEVLRGETKRNTKVSKKKVTIEIAKPVPKHPKETHSDDSDFEPEPERTPSKRMRRRTKSMEMDETYRSEPGLDFWIEVFVETSKRWLCVDCVKGRIDCASEMEAGATLPLRYVLAFDNRNCVKDVTRRYAAHYMSRTRRLRIDRLDPDWWNELFKPLRGRRTARDKREEAEMEDDVQNRPLPTTIGEFKSHPLYALRRHLLKFEAIYPADAPPMGYIRSEPIYARDCVRTLHSRETWLKQARTVVVGEEPYKVVKGRPKWDHATRSCIPSMPLDVFGEWQTEPYKPPVAKDGKVPRNEYGNVDMYQPCMLPVGTVHLRLPGLPRVARKLGIDYAAAFIGWDFIKSGNRPAFDGFIVCEEYEQTLREAWKEQQVIDRKREQEKREKRVYGNWRRLIRGVLIRERVKARYGGGNNDDNSEDDV